MSTKKRQRSSAWARLFDPEEVERGCAYVRDAVSARPEERGTAAATTLKTLLIEPLNAYIEDQLPPGADSARRSGAIYRAGERVPARAARLNKSQAEVASLWHLAEERGIGRAQPSRVDAARALALQVRRVMLWLECPIFVLSPTETHDALREAWRDFIIAGAAHLLYDGMEKVRAQRSHAGRQPRGRAKGVTADDIRKALQTAAGRTKEARMEAAAKKLNISSSTAWRRLAAERSTPP